MNEFKNRIKNTAKDEELNYYDENGKKLGIINRHQAIEQGLLIESAQIWIINPKTKEVLMQKRSKNKQNDPGMIDVSASGHVKPEETPMQAIIREGKEEVGKKAFEKLIPTIKKLIGFEIDFSKEGRKGRYINYEYIAFSTAELEEYEKQDEEVEKLFFMNYYNVKKLIENKDKNIRIPYNKITKKVFELIEQELENIDKEKTREEE